MTMSRAAKSAWQKRKRAEAALAAGRPPGRTGRPPTGRTVSRGKGDRRGQYLRRRQRLLLANGDNGTTERWHPVLVEAWEHARRHISPDRRAALHRPTFEDAVSEAVLALVAGEDPHEAVRRFVRYDRDWLMHTAPLLEENVA